MMYAFISVLVLSRTPIVVSYTTVPMNVISHDDIAWTWHCIPLEMLFLQWKKERRKGRGRSKGHKNQKL